MSVRSQVLYSIEGLESRLVSRSSLESNLESNLELNLEPSILESKPSKEKGEISFIQHNTARNQETLQTVLEIAFQREKLFANSQLYAYGSRTRESRLTYSTR